MYNEHSVVYHERASGSGYWYGHSSPCLALVASAADIPQFGGGKGNCHQPRPGNGSNLNSPPIMLVAHIVPPPLHAERCTLHRHSWDLASPANLAFFVRPSRRLPCVTFHALGSNILDNQPSLFADSDTLILLHSLTVLSCTLMLVLVHVETSRPLHLLFTLSLCHFLLASLLP